MSFIIREPAIKEFKGDHDFLSNFYPFPIIYRGLIWPTTEHAFQAAKFKNGVYTELIRKTHSPGKVKKMGRAHPIQTPDWERVKLDVMREVVWKKFSHPDMSWRLLETGEMDLVEGNTWGDEYWGVNIRKSWYGLNWLGRILMETRDRLWREMP